MLGYPSDIVVTIFTTSARPLVDAGCLKATFPKSPLKEVEEQGFDAKPPSPQLLIDLRVPPEQ